MLNIAIIAATLTLVALIFYGNRFHKTQPPPVTTTVDKTITKKTRPSRNAIETYTESKVINRGLYHKAEQLDSPLASASHPPKIAPSNHPPESVETPDNPAALRKILTRQSSELRTETLSQGMHPNDKRPLALSEKEIEELEKKGSMIY